MTPTKNEFIIINWDKQRKVHLQSEKAVIEHIENNWKTEYSISNFSVIKGNVLNINVEVKQISITLC